MSRIMRIVILFAACMAPQSVLAVQPAVGYIEEIHGTVEIGKQGQAERFLLDPAEDILRRLYPGDILECRNGGTAVVRLIGLRVNLAEPAGPFTVPAAPKSLAKDPRQKLLDSYLRVGGRDRSVRLPGLEILSPADDGAVMPGNARIRWHSASAQCNLAFELVAGKEIIWHGDDVNPSLGSFSPDSFHVALVHYRNQHPTGVLMLNARNSCGSKSSTRFRTLTEEAENQVNAELAAWQKLKETPLIQHLGLASIYDDAKLYPEAADEYEMALATAPKSRDLLTRTMVAQLQIGNTSRADELEKRLGALH